jgi:hypothetical protein
MKLRLAGNRFERGRLELIKPSDVPDAEEQSGLAQHPDVVSGFDPVRKSPWQQKRASGKPSFTCHAPEVIVRSQTS